MQIFMSSGSEKRDYPPPSPFPPFYPLPVTNNRNAKSVLRAADTNIRGAAHERRFNIRLLLFPRVYIFAYTLARLLRRLRAISDNLLLYVCPFKTRFNDVCPTRNRCSAVAALAGQLIATIGRSISWFRSFDFYDGSIVSGCIKRPLPEFLRLFFTCPDTWKSRSGTENINHQKVRFYK